MLFLSSLITPPRTKMSVFNWRIRRQMCHVRRNYRILKMILFGLGSSPSWSACARVWNVALEGSLRQKLVKDSRYNNLTEAAEVVLFKFGLDLHGNDLLMQQFEVFVDATSMTTLTKPAYPFYEADLKRHYRRKKGYNMLNAVWYTTMFLLPFDIKLKPKTRTYTLLVTWPCYIIWSRYLDIKL
jgi:hypothetical protein